MQRTRRSRLLSLLLAALPAALAQVPTPADKAFFQQPKPLVMVTCAETALALGANGGDELAQLGWVYLSAGQRDKAEEAFARAFRKGSLRFAGVFVQSTVNPATGLGESRAAPSFGKTDGAGAETCRTIGLALLRNGYKAEALRAYEAMGSADSQGFMGKDSSLTRAAIDLLKAGMVPEAIAWMETAYLADPRDANNFVDFGRAALLAGERDQAARYFALAVQVEPKDSDLWAQIAEGYADLLVQGRPAGDAKATPPAP